MLALALPGRVVELVPALGRAVLPVVGLLLTVGLVVAEGLALVVGLAPAVVGLETPAPAVLRPLLF